MRVAVIGGGLFGATAAVEASRAGLDVHLFERAPMLIAGATASTYSRLHRGYHYPRSPETGRESRLAEKSFRSVYGPAVIDGGRQTYIVAPGGHVTPRQYSEFLDTEGLSFSEIKDGVFDVVEPRVDLGLLRGLVRSSVAKSSVVVHVGKEPNMRSLRGSFDKIVVAAYAGINDVLSDLGCPVRPYKFQVVERPIVLLPEVMRGRSIVVVDGPFGCVDPLDDTPLHVLGHVVHTVHAENTGNAPEIPDGLKPLINAGFQREPAATRIEKVVSDLSRFVPEVAKSVYVGSSFTVRAVLADVEATDARPTEVSRVDEQVISVFSGKLGTAVQAAITVVDYLGRSNARRHRLQFQDRAGSSASVA